MSLGTICSTCRGPQCMCNFSGVLISNNTAPKIVAMEKLKPGQHMNISKFKVGQAVMFGDTPVVVNEVRFTMNNVLYSCRLLDGGIVLFDEFELEVVL